jgi:hypothetical protein
LARSSAFLIGSFDLVVVKKAARLAVYEANMMRAKKNQILATIRVELALESEARMVQINISHFNSFTYFGAKSLPCPIMLPIISQVLFGMIQMFSTVSGFWSHGCGFSQSAGAILAKMKIMSDTNRYAVAM